MSLEIEEDEHQDEEVSWEEKYRIADGQLQKFRSQAAKVRELLAKKMKVYEDRISDIEKQRDEAQDKGKKLETAVKDKDEAINALREKITTMRDERVQENEVWEERERKMKDWIKVKFTDMLKELEQVRKEKKELEATITPQKRDPIKGSVRRKSGGTDGSNIYEEIFGQILDDLQKPHYEILECEPKSPQLPPPTPKRPPSLKIRNRSAETGTSQKPVLRRIARFFSGDNSPTASPSLSTNGSKPTSPPPTARKPPNAFRRNSSIVISASNPRSCSDSPRPRVSTTSSEVFFPNRSLSSSVPNSDSKPLWNKVNTDSNENDVNGKASTDSRVEPFYFTLKETYSGIEFEYKDGEMVAKI